MSGHTVTATIVDRDIADPGGRVRVTLRCQCGRSDVIEVDPDDAGRAIHDAIEAMHPEEES